MASNPTLELLAADRAPLFPHGCEECIYLGSADETRHTDLYVHTGEGATVIARYGAEGDYISGLAFTDRVPQLALALVRAVKGNFLSF